MSVTKVRIHDLEEYDNAICNLSPRRVAEVREWELMASAYVWGREDAGDPRLFEGTVSYQFGLAYAIHRAAFIEHRIHYGLPILTAWQWWSTGRDLNGGA